MTIKVLVLVANGSEDIEVVTPIDIFRRAGYSVDICSIEETKDIELSRGVKIKAEYLLDEVEFDKYNLLFFPGGLGSDGKTGVNSFINYPLRELKNFVIENFSNPKYYFAFICAAPQIINHLGLMRKDLKVTCFDGCQEGFEQNWTGKKVEIDGNIITGKGAGCSQDFALEIVKKFNGNEALGKLETALMIQ